MTIDDVARGATAVVTVERGSTLHADGQVAGLTEEPEFLSRVEAAEDRAAETTTSLQLLQTHETVRRRSLLAPADRGRSRRMVLGLALEKRSSDLQVKKIMTSRRKLQF